MERWLFVNLNSKIIQNSSRKPKLMEVTIIEEVNVNDTSTLVKMERPVNLLSQLVKLLSLYFFYLYWEKHVKLFGATVILKHHTSYQNTQLISLYFL